MEITITEIKKMNVALNDLYEKTNSTRFVRLSLKEHFKKHDVKNYTIIPPLMDEHNILTIKKVGRIFSYKWTGRKPSTVLARELVLVGKERKRKTNEKRYEDKKFSYPEFVKEIKSKSKKDDSLKDVILKCEKLEEAGFHDKIKTGEDLAFYLEKIKEEPKVEEIKEEPKVEKLEVFKKINTKGFLTVNQAMVKYNKSKSTVRKARAEADDIDIVYGEVLNTSKRKVYIRESYLNKRLGVPSHKEEYQEDIKKESVNVSVLWGLFKYTKNV